MIENNSILDKFEGLEAGFEGVSTSITAPDVITDQSRYVGLTKEYRDLGNVMGTRKRYIACFNAICEPEDILTNETDTDMREVAREELQVNEDMQPQLGEKIKLALVPKDPEDTKNVRMEMCAGMGGDETALFAGDLFNMYKHYCDSKSWMLSVISVNESSVGDYKEVDFTVSSDNVYGTLKYESGVHYVQRTPTMETQGHMHTSAATVVVLPEADQFEVNVNEGDIKRDTFRSPEVGG